MNLPDKIRTLLHKSPCMTHAEIAKALRADKDAVRSAVQKMFKGGLLWREYEMRTYIVGTLSARHKTALWSLVREET